jgi:hypothetical protein
VKYRALVDLHYYRTNLGYVTLSAGTVVDSVRVEDIKDQSERWAIRRALRIAEHQRISIAVFYWRGQHRYASVGDQLEAE